MQLLGRNWHIKKAGGEYPSFVRGLCLSVVQCAYRLGLRVPLTQQLSGDAIGSEIVPNAKNLSDDSLQSASFPVSDLILWSLSRLIVFDYCVGCVNVHETPELLVRDVNNYPCYSERHNKNILWDGSEFWYIDYDHVFARTLFLFGLPSTRGGGLLDTIPAHEVHLGFKEIASMAISKFGVDSAERMRSSLRSVFFEENLWLPYSFVSRMLDIFHQRLGYL